MTEKQTTASVEELLLQTNAKKRQLTRITTDFYADLLSLEEDKVDGAVYTVYTTEDGSIILTPYKLSAEEAARFREEGKQHAKRLEGKIG